MKIGIMCGDLVVSGGAQRQVIELARCLRRMGHTAVIYTLYFDESKCYPNLVKGMDIVSNARAPSDKKGFSGLRVRSREIRRLVEKVDPRLDVLNLHLMPYPTATHIKKKFKMPLVVMINDVPLPSSGGDGRNMLIRGIASALRRMELSYYKKEIRRMDRLVVLDRRNQDNLMEHYGRESSINRSGLNLEEFAFAGREKNARLRILSTGIFFPHRRIEDILAALVILRDKGIEFSYDHVGTDKLNPRYAQKIYRFASEAGLAGAAKFHGYVTDEELVRFYRESDVFIFPNHPQTWGLAVFEAMACGTPTICSKGAGAHEVLTHGENSLLVPPKSPADIADSLERLHSDSALWRKLHLNGRAFVEANITWEIYAKGMMREFEAAAAELGGGP